MTSAAMNVSLQNHLTWMGIFLSTVIWPLSSQAAEYRPHKPLTPVKIINPEHEEV